MLSSNRLRQRSDLLRAVRAFFHERDYVETDTPVRLPVLLPESYITPFASEDWYLQSSPEQCMKRLLARGSSRLFQVCRCFRKGEVGRYHQPEFTMLEWYRAGWSYRELMDECEEFLVALVQAVPGLDGVQDATVLRREGRTISLIRPWQRLTVAEAFREYAGMAVEDALAKDSFDEVLVTDVEPRLGWDTPVFLCDYPAALGSLARKKAEDETIAERFELYVGGIELANGFSELTDPVEQRQRFGMELKRAKEQGNMYRQLPEKFLADLENLGETAGIALGLDRVFMILLGCAAVTEVMAIPSEEL